MSFSKQNISVQDFKEKLNAATEQLTFEMKRVGQHFSFELYFNKFGASQKLMFDSQLLLPPTIEVKFQNFSRGVPT